MRCILHHGGLESALAYRLAQKLSSGEMSEQILREMADEAYENEPALGEAARADIVAVYDRDPACHRFLQPLLYFKGFQAIQAYRVGHWMWGRGRKDIAYFIQMRVSEVFGIDIHPAARIGKGIMIDHAHSIVIGETAVVGDNVSMLHSVTLGGTGKETEDRHPKIGDGVLIGAGAKVLGNIRVGNCSRIAAGSVVLEEVPPCKTVAGVPARIVGEAGCDQPAMSMDHLFGGRRAPGALALMRVEEALAQPDRVRRHLDQLVVVDIGDGLFQRHLHRRRQAHRLVRARGADVGQLLALERVHLEVVVAGMLADDHALVDLFLRVDEHPPAILEVPERIGHRLAVFHRDQDARAAARDRALVRAPRNGTRGSGRPCRACRSGTPPDSRSARATAPAR
jgi:serine O-acetyltransferase